MQQRGPRPIAGEESTHALKQAGSKLLQRASITVLLRKRELIPQPPLAEEFDPIRRELVELGRAADRVVPIPWGRRAGRKILRALPR